MFSDLSPRTRSLSPLFLCVTLLVAGCDDKRPGQSPTSATVWPISRVIVRTVVRNTPQLIDFFASLNPDCSFGGNATVRTQAPPAHGALTIQEGQGYTNYPTNNQRYECNRQKSRIIEVLYTPAPEYTGSDEFVLHAIYPSGGTTTNKYTITVE